MVSRRWSQRIARYTEFVIFHDDWELLNCLLINFRHSGEDPLGIRAPAAVPGSTTRVLYHVLYCTKWHQNFIQYRYIQY